jgi:hypothetical protein
MKLKNPIPGLLSVLLVFQLSSCDDDMNDVKGNLRIIPKQVLSANIDVNGIMYLIPQKLMAEGGNPMNSYNWELDTASHLPASISVGEIDGIVTMSGTSGAGFKAGITNFKVVVSDGDNTSSAIVGLQITDYKNSTVAEVQQLSVKEYQLMNGKINQPYCASLFVMGGTPPYTWAIDSGYPTKLESFGLSLDPVYGLISGKIPGSASPLILSFKVEVRDSKGKYALFNPIYKITIK